MNTACERKKKNKNYTRNNYGKIWKSFKECLVKIYVACGLTFMKNELWNNSATSVLGSIHESLWISREVFDCLFHREDDLLPNAVFFMFTVETWRKKNTHTQTNKHLHKFVI